MKWQPEKVLESQVVLLCGTDNSTRLKALKTLLATAGLGDDDAMDIETVAADQGDPSHWFGTVATFPFLADRRAVVVRNLARLNPTEMMWSGRSDPDTKKTTKVHLLAEQLKAIPETGLLILVIDDERIPAGARPDHFQSRINAWKKLITATGGTVLSFEVPTENQAKHIAEHAESLGKTMTKQAASLLAEMLGGRVDLARDELEKLALYVGDAPQISETDIRATVTPDQEYNIWKLVDAVSDGNAALALTQFNTLISNVRDLSGEAFQTILPQLIRQFRLAWQARACVENRVPPRSPGYELDQWMPVKKGLPQEGDWVQTKAMKAAQRLDYPRLLMCFDILLDTDAKIKGQRSAMDLRDILEQCVMNLVEVCAGRTSVLLASPRV